jgi:hypothetical protein
MRYTADLIRSLVHGQQNHYFASYSEGRPEGWSCDQQVKDAVCISVWMNEELADMVAIQFAGADGVLIDDDDRRAQQAMFNRWSRSRNDLFELAAEVMNQVVDGTIIRDRVPHKRWG